MITPCAWDLTTGLVPVSGISVRIAVLDTGSTAHPDLARQWIGGYDFVTSPLNARDGNGRDSNPTDPGDDDASFHGTHVAGTVAAATNNRNGVAGVCWGCKVVPVRVLGYNGGTTADIADAIRWSGGVSTAGAPVNRYPAQVINMSLGGHLGSGNTCAVDDVVTQNAINAVVARGVTVAVAAGNDNADAETYSPAYCDNVLTLAATETRNLLASYSNTGSKVDIAAPGGDVSVDRNGDTYVDGVLSTGAWFNANKRLTYGYLYYQGTSMAAPHVAGVVGLMLSRNPNLTPAQIEAKLKGTATSIPCTGSGPGTCGAGLVNARKALE